MRWVMRRLVWWLVLVVVGPAQAEGVLWSLEDRAGEARAVLFGTVHLCDAACYPLDPAVREAFDAARLLALELDPANPQMAVALGRAGLLPAGERLDERLPADLAARLERAARATGSDYASLLRMRTWLASSVLVVTAAAQSGFEAERGIDLWLAGQARERGVPIVELETVERQIRALSAGGAETQQAMLAQIVDLILEAGVADYFDEIRRAWQRGDAGRLLEMAAEGTDPAQAAPLLDDLVIARNREMAARIAALAESERDVFVAIGAAHLAGDESVLAELRRLGFTVRPVR
ncbi:MAG: TraB/GumN family protein [Rhodocyclaceae bacterium]|nr:TraB/GumN family protein [Rhodocyclaceae bacterium]